MKTVTLTDRNLSLDPSGEKLDHTMVKVVMIHTMPIMTIAATGIQRLDLSKARLQPCYLNSIISNRQQRHYKEQRRFMAI